MNQTTCEHGMRGQCDACDDVHCEPLNPALVTRAMRSCETCGCIFLTSDDTTRCSACRNTGTEPEDAMNITQNTGKVWIVTVTRHDGEQFRSVLTEGTLDEVHAFVSALVDPTSTFRIEEKITNDAQEVR